MNVYYCSLNRRKKDDDDNDKMMFIHLQYVRKATADMVVVFDKEIIAVSDVLHKVSTLFKADSSLFRIYDEYGRQMKCKDHVQKARVYMLKRKPKYNRRRNRFVID